MHLADQLNGWTVVFIVSSVIWILVFINLIGDRFEVVAPIGLGLGYGTLWILKRLSGFSIEPWMEDAGWIILVLAGICLAAAIIAFVGGRSPAPVRAGGSLHVGVPTQISSPLPPPPKNHQPTIFWHGCKTLAGTYDIFHKNRWVVGTSNPPGVWLTTDFSYAARQAGDNGYILKVSVDSNVELQNHGMGRWLAPIRNAIRNSQHYRVPGVRAIEIYNPKGQKMA